MCGRYYIDQEDDLAEMRKILTELNKRFYGQPVLSAMKTGEIFPSNVVPVLQKQDKAQQSTTKTNDSQNPVKILPSLMRWGFNKSGSSGLLINARAETAAHKPFFRKAFIYGRILIPASAFFEWRKMPVSADRLTGGVSRASRVSAGENANSAGKNAGKAVKKKMKLWLDDEPTFYMAGLCQPADNITGYQFVILTTEAQQGIRHIHNRQPLILPRAWLRSWVLDADEAARQLDYVAEKPLQFAEI